jgi:hypothetical protein
LSNSSICSKAGKAVEVAMSLEPHFDAAGHFIHPCHRCGQAAVFGSGVSLRKGKLGTWLCGVCKLGTVTRDSQRNTGANKMTDQETDHDHETPRSKANTKRERANEHEGQARAEF